jgi:hypothetical protein
MIREVVFEAAEPARLARFWAEVIDGYAVRPYDEAEIARLAALGLTPETDPTVLVDGPGPSLCFQRVPGRAGRPNRLHLDVAVRDRVARVARLTALGGAVEREAGSYTVMRDPEGNQFCLVEAGGEAGS